MVLPGLGPDSMLFPFGYRQAAKILHATVRKTHAVTMPANQAVRWKDLRSGMACHLLKSGWTRDEVNARLGHTPHSSALDAYINFLALDRDKPKQRLLQTQTEGLQEELFESRRTAQLASERLHREEQDNRLLRDALAATRSDIDQLRHLVESLVGDRAAPSLRHVG